MAVSDAHFVELANTVTRLAHYVQVLQARHEATVTLVIAMTPICQDDPRFHELLRTANESRIALRLADAVSDAYIEEIERAMLALTPDHLHHVLKQPK
jgi:hypothetical protein